MAINIQKDIFIYKSFHLFINEIRIKTPISAVKVRKKIRWEIERVKFQRKNKKIEGLWPSFSNKLQVEIIGYIILNRVVRIGVKYVSMLR